jgi:hypothetical protein
MTKSNEPWRDDAPDDVSVMLGRLPEVDPPAGLVDSVMSTIACGARTDTMSPPVTFIVKGNTMAKKVLWSIAAAAAVALVIMRAFGYPPVGDGTEATIGAAQRYQAPQISSTDVKLEDAQLQAFLQSDLFRRLAADKAAQQALRNKDFQHALSDSAVRAALASPDIRAAIADATAKAAGDARILAANNAALAAALESSAALRVALVAPGVAEAIANSALGVALAQSEVAFALSHDAVVQAVLGAAGSALDAAATSSNATAGARTEAAGNAAR